MQPKQIKLVIPSEFENAALIGPLINKICTLVPFSEGECDQIELCVIEAVNNSIQHAYEGQKGNEVEICFSIYHDRIVCDVCDCGKMMDSKLLEQDMEALLDFDPEDLENIPEEGRGLPIMKAIMDAMTYKSVNGKNCLTMMKKRPDI